MGTVEADVNSATTSSSVFKGNQAGTTYDTGTMVGNKTYYWRIDEKNAGGTTKGDIWHFTTLDNTKATNPSPTNEATVNTLVNLTWTAGTGTTSHDVYLGTVEADVNRATTGSSVFKGNQAGNTYDPTLASSKTYYWRIDERNAEAPRKATVWSFTTQTTSLTLSNSAYKVVLDQNFVDLSIKNKDANVTSAFTTQFTVIYNATRPKLSSTSDLTATWTLAGKNLFGTGTNTSVTAVKAEIIDSNLVLTYDSETNFDFDRLT